MNIDEFLTRAKGDSPESNRKRSRPRDDDEDRSNNVKKSMVQQLPASGGGGQLDISEEERLRILKMLEDEPEGIVLDEQGLKRMISVLEKKIAKNQEMRIKFPDQPEKFMESEVELHEAIQELHALATMPDLYPLAVESSLPTILLGLLPHENADISCAVLNLLQELTDVDTLNENEEATISFIDNFLSHLGVSLLTQNLDRLDESNKDESDGVHNTLSIFENLFEVKEELCVEAAKNGLLHWILKRLRARLPFDANKLYAAEILSILLQDTIEIRSALGDLEGIDSILQQLAAYKRSDPTSNEEAEYMENMFNCLCTSLLHAPNREKFLKGEGPQLMNLMLREKKQSRSGALKVLNHAVSGPEGTANANKFVDILGLRTVFPLFMKTPKKSQRKGMSASEHEEHVLAILVGVLQHTTGPTRTRILSKFEENDFEKVERLGELHFRYFEKVNRIDMGLRREAKESGIDLDEDEHYLKRLEGGLFCLQLVDYIILDVCASSARVKERLIKIITLKQGNISTIKDVVKEYSENLGEENKEWKYKLQQSIDSLLENF